MERLEFFGTAVFVPVFMVSIGLLLEPSVMVKGETLKLAALICAAALGGKAVACWLAGSLLGFSRPERAAMYVLTVPQAAATLAVTLIGFEIGLFGTTVVNAVLVLILVSIVLSALLAQKVVDWLPVRAAGRRPLGSNVVVVTSAGGPSDAAVRAATLLARPDGGRNSIVIARAIDEPSLDAPGLRALEKRIHRHGFDGELRVEVDELSRAVTQEVLNADPSLVVVDDASFDASPGNVPLVVVSGAANGAEGVRVIAAGDDRDALHAEVVRRLARGQSGLLGRRRSSMAPTRRV